MTPEITHHGRVAKLIHCLLFAALITGCANHSNQVMKPIEYKQTLPTTTHKHAYLKLKTGEIHSDLGKGYPTEGPDAATNLASALKIEHLKRKNSSANPYKYGPAQQQVFMNSLSAVLVKENVFDSVAILTGDKPLDKGDVLITIEFDSTYVGPQELHFPISLDVEVFIKEPQKPLYKKELIVQSPKPKKATLPTFKKQQKLVSEKLMREVIDTIEAWDKN